MAAVSTRRSRRHVRVCLDILQSLLADCRPRDFAVRLWDGSTWPAEPGLPTRFTLVVACPGSLRRMLLRPSELSLAEAYIFGGLDVEGDMEAAIRLTDHLAAPPTGLAGRIGLAARLLSLPPHPPRERTGRQAARLHGAWHSLGRDRAAVAFHYDVPSRFYSLWLDDRMVYSCGYFTGPQDGLEAAQERKLDYICRKLRLAPGERFLDIGCGFGGLVIHAARHYGVTACGVTLSLNQATTARERVRAAGLSGACRIDLLDYREIEEPGGFDKVASVGMFEHVGADRLAEYFGQVYRLLRPRGVFLNHGIAGFQALSSGRGPSFVDRYVFPDGELVPVSATLKAAEACGFEVRDLESLREHYTLTLRHWVRRLEADREEALAVVDEATYRTWRLYMSGAARYFDTGRQGVYQALLVKTERGRSGLPLTRADWYARAA
jgi:cyclopropane-fatty-acyl-phospholipid synthase